MKAVRVHQPGDASVLTVDEVPEPKAGPGELLFDVEATGVNFIEIYQREGLYPMERPYIVGAEAGGTVRAIGAGVTDFRVGDRVVTERARGAYAERTTVAAEHAVRVPNGIAMDSAVALWLQGLTAHYLATSTYPLTHESPCLIHAAAGGVGLLFCQIAGKRGAHVIGTAGSDEKCDLARRAGARAAINYRTHDFAAEVRRLTAGRGLDVVFDSVGASTYEKSIDCLAPRGMLVLFGQSSGKVPPIDPLLLNRKGSLYLTRPTLAHYVATRDELLGRARDLFDWVQDGSLDVRIGARFSLGDAAAAHRALQARETTGKVILAPG